MSLPLNIPSIIGQIVTDTATALGYNIAYLHGTWNHIRERITTAQGGYSPNAVFPLVCLVQVFEEKFKDDSEYSEATLTLLICNNSQPDWHSEDRYTNNYIPTLYPIYSELMQQLNQSQYVVGYKERYHEHTKVDDLHLPETNANKLPECLDGLWVNDLKLRLVVPPCNTSPTNLCGQTPCANGATVDYLQAITSIGYAKVGNSTINLVPVTSGTGTLLITIPPNSGVLTGTSLNVTTAPDGLYVGTITFGLASHQFFYEVKGAKFEHYPIVYINTLTANVNCYNYVLNNGYRISYSYSSEYHNVDSVAFIAQIDGVQIGSNTFHQKAITVIGSGSFQNLSPINLTQILTLDNGITLTSQSFLKLKCQ